jgi:glycerol uptake facilitator-like aquaporin
MNALGQVLFVIVGVAIICSLKDSSKNAFGKKVIRWAFGISCVIALPWLVIIGLAVSTKFH